MAQAVSLMPLNAVGPCLVPGQSVWDLDRFISWVRRHPLSVSFHQCTTRCNADAPCTVYYFGRWQGPWILHL